MNHQSRALQTHQSSYVPWDIKEAELDEETLPPVDRIEVANGNQPSQPLQTLQGNGATQDNNEAVPDDETLPPLYSIVNKREIANDSQSYRHDDTIVETRKVESTVEFADADEIPPPLPPPCKDTAMLVAPTNAKSMREVPKAG